VLDTPQIVETADQLTASLSLVVPSAEIQSVMGPSIREVYAALAAQGIAPAGPWFTHHRRQPADTFDFDVCVPVAAPIAAMGRVNPGRRPAARVARAVYNGPYEGLPAAWGELCAWIEANGHTRRPDLWECYLNGPESSDDPADWRTELNQPLIA
jgi:effector-binding domain-containing protein